MGLFYWTERPLACYHGQTERILAENVTELTGTTGTDSSVVGSGPFALDSDIMDIIVIVICHSSKTLTDIRKGDVKTLVEQKRVYTKSLVILF